MVDLQRNDRAFFRCHDWVSFIFPLSSNGTFNLHQRYRPKRRYRRAQKSRGLKSALEKYLEGRINILEGPERRWRRRGVPKEG